MVFAVVREGSKARIVNKISDDLYLLFWYPVRREVILGPLANGYIVYDISQLCCWKLFPRAYAVAKM